MRRCYWFLNMLLSLIVLSCTEIGPEINPLGGQVTEVEDTTALVQKVLIEEFTGVRCVNCPAGTAEVLRLQNIYQGRLVAVSIHAGSFAVPYTESQMDFRIPESDGILNYLGTPLGYPSAVINRRLFPDERDLQLGKNQWPAFVEEELNRSPLIRIRLNVGFEPISRRINLSAELTPQQDLSGEQARISVMLIEDEIVDVQLTPNGKKNDYFHRHSLRDMLTAFSGNPLDESMEFGKTINRSYNYTLPAEWDETQCSLIVFVHRDGADQSILQVEEIKLL